MGSPPPAGSKNEVFKFRSVKSIVMAPARTGRDSKRRITVIVTAHTKSGIRSNCSPCQRIFTTVVIKLMAPRMEEAPAKCSEKIARSTEGPEWAILDANGG
jgi:hypothetical protein